MTARERMVTCGLLISLIVLIFSCTQPVFDNPLDPEGTAYEPLVVVLRGENPAFVEVGENYVDSGVVVRAYSGEDFSARVVRTGDSVVTTAPDTFVVLYAVSDGRGFTASCSRIVIVVPRGTLSGRKPRIVLQGGDTLYHTVNTPFVDPGATATDAGGTDLTPYITVSGWVNDTLVGVYVLTYSVVDSAGNYASRTRIVRVVSAHIQVDTVPPVITILGANPAQVRVGETFIDEGATAYDAEDGDISALIQSRSTVSTASVGTDTVIYWVTDRAGNRAEARRLVLVVSGDTEPPVITLVGPNPLVLMVGDTLRDPGATAIDNCDGDLSARVVMEHNVNTRVAGTYSMTYRVTDNAGNTGVKTRVVQVRAPIAADTVPPVITLHGANPLVLALGATFVDPGAVATDETDGDLTARIVVTHDVNTARAGEYLVTYTVSDAAGNRASSCRTVIVREGSMDTVKPVITLHGDNPLRLTIGAVFVDPGATAYDNVDGDISARIEVTHNVNTAVAGTYSVTYTVRDAAGNTTTATRSVEVNPAGTATLTMNVMVAGDNSTIYTFATYSNSDGWTPEQVKIIVQPLGGGQVSGSITVNGVVHQLSSPYYNAIVVPNTGGTVRCAVNGTFQIGLGL